MNDKTIFGKGEKADAHFSGDAWVNMLPIDKTFDCMVYNVTFAAGVRNDWHKHTIGQILLCTAGEGYYQARGEKAQHLKPGDVVNIPAHTEHWHGATPNSEFTHVGITPRQGENRVDWLAPVSEEAYKLAIK